MDVFHVTDVVSSEEKNPHNNLINGKRVGKKIGVETEIEKWCQFFFNSYSRIKILLHGLYSNCFLPSHHSFSSLQQTPNNLLYLALWLLHFELTKEKNSQIWYSIIRIRLQFVDFQQVKSRWKIGNPKAIENSEGAQTTPSVIAFNQ